MFKMSGLRVGKVLQGVSLVENTFGDTDMVDIGDLNFGIVLEKFLGGKSTKPHRAYSEYLYGRN